MLLSCHSWHFVTRCTRRSVPRHCDIMNSISVFHLISAAYFCTCMQQYFSILLTLMVEMLHLDRWFHEKFSSLFHQSWLCCNEILDNFVVTMKARYYVLYTNNHPLACSVRKRKIINFVYRDMRTKRPWTAEIHVYPLKTYQKCFLS